MERQEYNLSGTIGDSSVSLKLAPPKSSMLDMSVYAPAIPGVLVALVGVWLTSRLAQRRERRKEVLELCDKFEVKVDEALTAVDAAWHSQIGYNRDIETKKTKRLLQDVGRLATSIRKHSACGRLREFLCFIGFSKRITEINVISSVSSLKRAIFTEDFEEPNRSPPTRSFDDSDQYSESVLAAAGELLGRLGEQRLKL